MTYQQQDQQAQQGRASDVLDAVVVGAGFAGLYMSKQLADLGLAFRCFEAGSGVGGTWYWNRYPGAQCDVESLEYSYSFSNELQQDWHWSQRFAAQAEILAYANHVADRFSLRQHVQFDTRVLAAAFDEAAGLWTLTLSSGESVRARHCITFKQRRGDRLVPRSRSEAAGAVPPRTDLQRRGHPADAPRKHPL